MARRKDKIVIKEIKVLGTYGKYYHNADVYPHTLKKLSKDVKQNDKMSISLAAYLLSQIVTPHSILIPIPQAEGRADYTLNLAQSIKELRNDCEVFDILCGNPREKLHKIKKSNPSLKGVDLGFRISTSNACKETLESNPNVFFCG